MGRITETVKILLIVNIIFYIGANFMIPNAYELFSLYFFENPNFQFWQPVTHMFMHGQLQYGGITHILFNMYALWAFGSPLEQMWGRNKFLFFYLSAGIGAAMIHSLVNYYHFQSGYMALLNAGISEVDVQNMLQQATQAGSYFDLPGIPHEDSQSFFTSYNIPAVGASGAIY